MLTEVLKEREAQLELQKLCQAASAGKDKEWQLKAQKDLEEGIVRDQEEAFRRIHQNRDTAAFQKAQ